MADAFTCLLDRAPSPHETHEFMAHFSAPGQNQVTALHETLLRSEEFRNRRLRMYQWSRIDALELDRPRVVFMHVERCGGTTMRAMLAPLFDPSRICPERFDGLGNWTINELAAYDLFAGHFDLAVCRSIPGDARVFTMLREPKARLLSLYRFWRSHPPHPDRDRHRLMPLARALDEEAFFAHPLVVSHPSIRNAITGQFIRTSCKNAIGTDDPLVADESAALENAWAKLRGLAGFGLLERFEESRIVLNEALGLAMQPTVPRQALAGLAGEGCAAASAPIWPITPQLDSLLQRLTSIDRPLYARARSLFEHRLNRHRGLIARVKRRALARSH